MLKIKQKYFKALSASLHGKVSPNEKREKVENDTVEFTNCKSLTCFTSSSKHEKRILALEPYQLHGKQYIASAGGDHTIKLWDLEDNYLIATLTGHSHEITSLAVYVFKGLPMLASSSVDSTVRIWNLSKQTNVHTLSVESGCVYSLATYELYGRPMLAGGCNNSIIKIWDMSIYDLFESKTRLSIGINEPNVLKNKSLLSECIEVEIEIEDDIAVSLEGHKGAIISSNVFYQDGKPYLVSGCEHNFIKMWCLTERKLVSIIHDGYIGEITALVTLQQGNKIILASGYFGGRIKLWDMESRKCIATFQAHEYFVNTLEVIRWNGIMCLISGSYDRNIKVWDLDSKTVIDSFKNKKEICTVKAFMNGDRPCLASGNYEGSVSYWT